MVNLIFIGTGSGKTSLSRFHASILISTSNTNLLVDAGDGISKALLMQDIQYNSIEGIFFTHLHSDHYTGLPSLITQMKMNERRKDLNIFADPGLMQVLKGMLFNSYLFDDRLGFRINYINVVQNVQFVINRDLKILSRQNSHLNSVSNSYKSKISFSSSSLMITADNHNVHFTSDIGSAEDLKLFNDSKIDLLISEFTHIKAGDIINLLRDKSELKEVILTHIDPENETFMQEFDSHRLQEIGKRIIFAYDGLKITL